MRKGKVKKKSPLLTEASQLPRVDSNTILFQDTETTGLDKLRDAPFLHLLRIHGVDYALDYKSGHTINWLNDHMPVVADNVFHNAKYDLHMLSNMGLSEHVVRSSEISCTVIMETLINEHWRQYGLDDCCRRRGFEGKDNSALLGWLRANFPDVKERDLMGYIRHAPLPLTVTYGVGDVQQLEKLYYEQLPELDKQNLHQIWELERDVTRALLYLERTGVPIDEEKIYESGREIEKYRRGIEAQIYKLVGFDLNVRSNPQMRTAFDKLDINYVRNEKTGNGVFNKDALGALKHPLARLVLDLRSARVMEDLFLGPFQEFLYPDGRIHCDFNQTKTDDYGTKTGRLSASNPNLQQVPKRNKALAQFIRSLFIALNGYRWVRHDWSQFEFRMFAHYTRSQRLLDTFIKDRKADYHQAVSNLTGLVRDPHAKQLNLGLIFGMGEGLMAMKCGMPYRTVRKRGKEFFEAGPQAKKIFRTYHQNIPEVKPMLARAERLAKKRGYVKTIFGRRIRFPGKRGVHKAAGLVFQGSSADMMKWKTVQIDNYCAGQDDIEFNLVVHDEFNNQIPDGAVHHDAAIKEILEDTPQMRLPVFADAGVGRDWWEASQE